MKNFNKIFTLVIIMVIILSALLLISCDKEPEKQDGPFKVTFLDEGVELKVLETIDGKITLPEDPAKEEHVFEGWFVAGTDEKFNPEEKITKDIQVYAKWKVKEYTLTFKDGDKIITTKDVVNGEAYGEVPKLEERVGYSYKWMLSEEEIKEYSTINLTEDVTINALWVPNKYYVTLDTKEGQMEEHEVTYDSTYGELFAPTKEGYTLDGWYLGETKIEPTTKVTLAKNHELTIKWTPNTYTLSFVTNIDGETRGDISVTYDSTYTNLPTLEKIGHSYEWRLDENEIKEGDTVKITKDSTLTAVWTANTYTLFFDAQGGTSTSDASVTYGETYQGKLSSPTKTGYAFDGWYLNGNKINEDSIVTTADNHTLVAHWTANE